MTHSDGRERQGCTVSRMYNHLSSAHLWLSMSVSGVPMGLSGFILDIEALPNDRSRVATRRENR
jgi:hypothetical protein